MKALTIKQPYAELILQGKKVIELRKWKTNFRGEFLIHASNNIDKEAMKKYGFDDLPVGAIVGKAKLVDVKEYKSEKEHKKDKHLHLVEEYKEKYAFILKEADKYDNPVPCKGALNFWDFK
ncbi:ASCH domain-containing protein [Candidatus Woesearchaeota archaeon]|nr:ASCH domain-containing protein [Candidatus Woesearchaeota archaeon]